jgi:hypothetical protein
VVRYVEIPHRTVFGAVRAINSAEVCGSKITFGDIAAGGRCGPTAQSRVAPRLDRQDADSARETASMKPLVRGGCAMATRPRTAGRHQAAAIQGARSLALSRGHRDISGPVNPCFWPLAEMS